MLEIFRRRHKKAIDACAKDMAQMLAERFGPDDQRAGADNKAERRLARALDGVHARANDFNGEHGLGVYGKARLGNTFKWELRELGYEHEFIEEVTRRLILRLGAK